ncbi:MAG TPA: beta-propeller fold lactonase family protein [Terracidiphilus sp.]|nr:beta-propeller fold lactonase family protein [Terracidiphilus sp.]
MKFNKSSQLLLVSAASILVAGLMTACATFTVDFVFVASSKAAGPNNYGEINIFEVNSGSGKMRQIPASPVPSGGRYPVAEAVSSDNQNLFVVNQDDNNIVQFVIGNDGKLYPYNTVNTPGVFPLAVAVNASNLFVADTYQPLPSCSTASPCSGSIAVFPLSAATSKLPVTLGSPASNPNTNSNYWPLTLAGKPTDVIVPTGVNVLASGTFVYVSAYDSSVTPNVGYVFGFTVGSGGVLTPLAGSPFAAGVLPSAIASDASGKYVYVTDYASGNIRGFSASAGALTSLAGSPFPAGNAPSAIVVDPSFSYAYVTNSTDSSISAYSMSNGVLTRIGNYPTGLQPVAIGIDPSTNHFLYTANFLGNNVSGFQLSQTAGTLLVSQYSPFPSNNQPTAVAAIPHNGTGAGVH